MLKLQCRISALDKFAYLITYVWRLFVKTCAHLHISSCKKTEEKFDTIETQMQDGALYILNGTNPTSGCGAGVFFRQNASEWEREAVIRSNAGQKVR